MPNSASSSGEITSSFENVSNVFTSYTEIPSEGFNRLFKAQRYGKWFVLKGLKPEHQHEEVYSSLLTKEFELGVQMDHPNIVRTFSKEFDSVVGHCIVMEYVDGCTLKEFLSQKPPRATRTKIAREILSAMSYFHGKQIIHRDLKPDNILITHNGHNVKIIDFGLADTDYHGILKQPAGSDKYAAPEQKAGNVAIDNRADIYAFGVILRQLFPHGYMRIARKCTQPDREKRFSNAEAILQRLNHRLNLIIIILALLCAAALVWLFLPKSHNNKTEIVEPETITTIEEIPSEASSIMVTESNEISAEPISKEVAKHPEEAVKEAIKTPEQNEGSQIPLEAKKMVESSLDTLFRRFWDWDKAATARGLSPKEKLKEYQQSDFFKNNYTIRERHREAVVNDLLRRYPQCEPVREQVVTFYNSLFVKRMVAVNNVVYEWQKAAR